MKRADLIGSEFEWYGVDDDGFVAVFFSQGWGPIPDVVFDRFECLESIESKVGLSLIPVPDAGFQATSRRLTELGIFGYDWEDSFGPYICFARPGEPKFLSDMDFAEDAKTALVHLTGVRFKENLKLVSSILPAFTDVEDRLGPSSKENGR